VIDKEMPFYNIDT